jgi:hypothetical protein
MLARRLCIVEELLPQALRRLAESDKRNRSPMVSRMTHNEAQHVGCAGAPSQRRER